MTELPFQHKFEIAAVGPENWEASEKCGAGPSTVILPTPTLYMYAKRLCAGPSPRENGLGVRNAWVADDPGSLAPARRSDS